MKITTYAQTELPLNLNLVKGLSGSGMYWAYSIE